MKRQVKDVNSKL